jgi:adenylylsulfate kinase
MKKKIKRNKGIIFWIEGFSGSGKSTISKLINKQINKKFGKTIVLSGDHLRKFFSRNKFSKKERIKNSYIFSNFLKFLTDQKINIIYSVVCLNNKARMIYKNKFENFVSIFLKADINKIIKLNKKSKIYKKKNILGIDITPEYPKNPDIELINDFSKNKLKKNARILLKKISQIIKY